ncbi:MAG: hypothetical protein F4X40_02890 [Chloroflexi bacterium]|nr:hypothetical protein [Chloroflexota bacterium]
MSIRDAGNEFLTKAGCFQATADELQAKLSQATLALQHGGTGDARKIGGYLFSTMILQALAAECALKALAAKSTGKYRRDKHGHDLSKLYDDLTPQVKELVDSIAESLGIASPKTILEKHRGDFVDWRYPSDDGRVLSANFSDLQRALIVLTETLNHKRFLDFCRETHSTDRPNRSHGG